jgi:hypothetical protein
MGQLGNASMTYTFLLESVWHPPLAFAETPGRTLPPELELQALWFSGAFGRDFRTLDGQLVRIVQFGEWNRGAGPDFRQVAVELDGELKVGDLELDTCAADWEWHRHGSNESFREVVLHVSFLPEARRTYVRTCEHRGIPQVLISHAQLADALNRPQQEVAIARPGRCIAPLRHLPIGAVERLLQEAAEHRADLKATRYRRVVDVHGTDAALFQATAETLGYRGNSLAMRMLTQRVPLSALGSDANRTDAILFGAAGFLSPELHEKAPDDTREYLRDLWENWWRERASYEATAARAIPWRFGGQRPANHPHRRIGTLATLARKWPTYRKLALARPFQPRAVMDFLEELEHSFWSRRHTLSSSASSSKISLFGRTQALELLANHLIPLALQDKGILFRDYHKLRSSAPNEKVKRCALRLFGSMAAAEPWLKRVAYHQALLQIYQDFCLEDYSDCANCPFPEQLSQWR